MYTDAYPVMHFPTLSQKLEKKKKNKNYGQKREDASLMYTPCSKCNKRFLNKIVNTSEISNGLKLRGRIPALMSPEAGGGGGAITFLSDLNNFLLM